MPTCRFILATAILLLGIWGMNGVVQAQGWIEEEVSFQSGNVTLRGTLFIPERSNPGAAIVLVHGAGVGMRDENRSVAESFVREGILTLIYDKRTDGYAADGIGGRSYSLLADDVIAAVEMLQLRADVDPTQVGVWGLSEGGWVAPLAAARSDAIAFVITVAGGGIGPLEQTAWAVENMLRRRGVTSEGSLRALTERAYRFLGSADLFPEASYDPAPALEQLRQPVLALWGASDQTMPPAASARIMQEALERGGNLNYTLRLIPDASHDVYAVADGQALVGVFAPDYMQTMIAWVHAVTRGGMIGSNVDALPTDELPTRPAVTNLGGFARWEIQLVFFVGFQITFGGYFITAAMRRRQGMRTQGRSDGWLAWTLAALGLATSWGLYCYIGYIALTAGEQIVGVIAGRPAGWFVLQLLAVSLVVAAIRFGFAWLLERRERKMEHILLLIAALLFVPWAVWWQLFSP